VTYHNTGLAQLLHHSWSNVFRENTKSSLFNLH